MKAIWSRAPGKAVLIGEYAVLDGAPALSMAVDRYARVELTGCEPGQSELLSPQLSAQPLSFRLNPNGQVDWAVDQPGYPALRQTAEWLSSLYRGLVERFGPVTPFRLRVDTRDLFIPTQAGDADGAASKLGLGSSSAVAVALDAALRRWVDAPEAGGLDLRALDRLMQPYRRGQGGQGSGIDVVSALCGGITRFRRCGGQIEAERRRLPDGLQLLFVWTGQSASTPQLLGRFRDWQARSPSQARRLLDAMSECSEAADRACVTNDAEALQASLHRYGELMSTMGDGMGQPLCGDVHAELRAEAEALGLASKPSGAGVGDLGLVAGVDRQAISRMLDWLEQRQLTVLPLGLDVDGVQTGLIDPEAAGRPE